MVNLKFIPSLLLSIFCATSCISQTTSVALQPIAHKPVNVKLEKYRQLFWDSLPKPTSYTNDYEGLFSDTEKEKLDSIIAAFENETTTQICIVTLDTMCTRKEKFDDLALHIATTWGVGQKDKNNGVVICISKGYRRIRIENGVGIEKILSNEETKEIIDNYFIPKFKTKEYFKGTMDGVVKLISTLKQKLTLE